MSDMPLSLGIALLVWFIIMLLSSAMIAISIGVYALKMTFGVV